jgi:quercetin dioxygenase-like cupin family protein
VLGGAAAATIGVAVVSTTPGNTTSTLVGPLARYAPFKVQRRIPSEWAVKIEAKQGVSIATQTITFEPGHKSGWHSHPGPVFISVKQGTMSFYDDHCNRIVRTAGEGFLDVGDDEHFAINETDTTAINVVTYFVPPDQTQLRFDEPMPVTCPIQ